VMLKNMKLIILSATIIEIYGIMTYLLNGKFMGDINIKCTPVGLFLWES
jgi:hypothetical protein